jgi:hypothetical protein
MGIVGVMSIFAMPTGRIVSNSAARELDAKATNTIAAQQMTVKDFLIINRGRAETSVNSGAESINQIYYCGQSGFLQKNNSSKTGPLSL